MTKWKAFYLGAWGLIVVSFIAFLLVYNLGGSRVRIGGVRADLPNQNVYQLYRINDSAAIEITQDFIEIIGYEKTTGVAALAGEYRVNGDEIFMVTADYLKGDYIYSAFPQGRTTIINIKTGETVGKAAEEGTVVTDVGELEEYKTRELTADEQYRLTKEMVEQQFEPLNTFDENVYTILLAFIFIAGIMVLLGIIMGIKDLSKKTKEWKIDNSVA